MVASPPEWICDGELGRRFVQATLTFPDDDDGPVRATIVRNEPLVPRPRGAVLYLHGFIDYFFQAYVADLFNAWGYDYYALDLRKYGRSLGRVAHPNFCRALEEYFAEIDAAIGIVVDEGHERVVLKGHSTGGLVAAVYAKDGRRCERIAALILNSPFLDFKECRASVRLAAWLGRRLPYLRRSRPVNRWYARSLHESCKGTWRFNTEWKPLDGFDAYYGWIRAVLLAQERVAGGLGLTLPMLVMHSDASAGGDEWSEEFRRADLVLDVEDIRRLAGQLGTRVERVEIPGGVHDLVLSDEDVRARVFDEMRTWLEDVRLV